MVNMPPHLYPFKQKGRAQQGGAPPLLEKRNIFYDAIFLFGCGSALLAAFILRVSSSSYEALWVSRALLMIAFVAFAVAVKYTSTSHSFIKFVILIVFSMAYFWDG